LTLYHTALKKGFVTYSNVKETESAVHPKGVMLKNDIISNGLPEEFDRCDVLCAEPPWPKGFKIFNDRAGVAHESYSDLVVAFIKIIENNPKPIYLIIGESMLKRLPMPREVHKTTQNGGDALVAVWHGNYDGSCKSVNVICESLGSRYKCLGDFTCGYGTCIVNFLSGGGSSFVASDYDGKCITVMSTRMKKIK